MCSFFKIEKVFPAYTVFVIPCRLQFILGQACCLFAFCLLLELSRFLFDAKLFPPLLELRRGGRLQVRVNLFF